MNNEQIEPCDKGMGREQCDAGFANSEPNPFKEMTVQEWAEKNRTMSGPYPLTIYPSYQQAIDRIKRMRPKERIGMTPEKKGLV